MSRRDKTDTADTTSTDEDSVLSSGTIETTFLHLPQTKIKSVVGTSNSAEGKSTKKTSFDGSVKVRGCSLVAATASLSTIAFVGYFLYMKPKSHNSQVYTADGFRNNCLTECKPFMECAITTLNCRCVYGYRQVANQCIVQTSPVPLCERCRKNTDRDCNNAQSGCTCVNRSQKTKIKFCTRPSDCSKVFNEATSSSNSSKQTSLADGYFESFFRSYEGTHRESEVFKYFHAISLIRAAQHYERCTVLFSYDCLDLLQRAVSTIQPRVRHHRLYNVITKTYSFVKDCVQSPRNCSSLLPRGDLAVDVFVRMGVEATTTLHALQQFGYFASRITYFNFGNFTDYSLSVTALILNILITDAKWARQKEFMEKKLKQFRLLKYDGEIWLGLDANQRNLLESKCIRPIMRSYTNFIRSQDWLTNVQILKEIKEPPKSCVLHQFHLSGGIWSQKTVKSEAKHHIVPLWMFNEFCLRSIEDECQESLVASVFTELFLKTYEVVDCEGFECEYIISHILCNMEELCDVKKYMVFRIWVHAVISRNAYYTFPNSTMISALYLPSYCNIEDKF